MLNINYPKLYKLADKLQKKYLTNSPFPHIAINNFLSPSDYSKVKSIFPSSSSKIWKKPSNRNTQGKSVTIKGKYNLKEIFYDKKTKILFHELNSSLFLHFLERLTGIKGLLPDPYFNEGGFHRSENGGFLNIHADFSHHDQLGLERRLNILFYLNEKWEDSYNGFLSLYDKKIKKVSSYSPIGNRLVVFTTSDFSYHGHPEKLNLPKNVYRKSLAFYYYSLPRSKRKKKKIVFPEDKSFKHSVSVK